MDGYLPPTEAAQLIGIHPQTVRIWGREGRIRRIQIHSKLYLYSKADLLREAQQLQQQKGGKDDE